MKTLLLIFPFFFFSAKLLAQGFEGEIDYAMRDTAGKHSTMYFYSRPDASKMFGSVGGSSLSVYLTHDSVAFVVVGVEKGFMLHKDSALVYFQSLVPSDSLFSAVPSSKHKVISGFHCTLITANLRSGKKKEFWVTSDVDTATCYKFARSNSTKFGRADGTQEFILQQNQAGKVVIVQRTIGLQGQIESESIITKLIKRTVRKDEVELPAGTKILHVTPQFLREISK